MKKKILVICSILVILFSESCSVNVPDSKIFLAECDSPEIKKTDIRIVFGHPERFDDRYIEISGFYESGFEKSALYVSKLHSDDRKAILIDLPEPNSLYLKSDKQQFWNQTESDSMNMKKIKIIGKFEYFDENVNTSGNDEYIGRVFDICHLEIFR